MEVQRKHLRDIQDPAFMSVIPKVAACSMHCHNGDIEVLYAFWRNIEYIVKNKIPGAIVECGVWRGGMMMLAALALQHFGDTERGLWLYDTFSGIPEPDEEKDEPLIYKTWAYWQSKGMKWGYGGPKEDVMENMASTGYPPHEIRFVDGMVEQTAGCFWPKQVALLRIDTDLYSPTYASLNHLYKRLSRHGVLVLDDYGLFDGARKAADDYFQEFNTQIMLSRIGPSVYEGVKLGP